MFKSNIPGHQNRNWVVAIGLALLGVLTVSHIYLLNQSWDVRSPLALADRLFELVWVGVFALTSVGLGKWFLHKFGWHSDSVIETASFSFGLGAGMLSLELLLTGLFRILYEPVVIGLLLGQLLITSPIWRDVFTQARVTWRERTPLTRTERWVVIGWGMILLPILLSTWVPPTDVDALGYHLVAPKIFLHEHAVIATRDNIGINYPIGVDLLYVLGLAVESDLVAQLIHFSFGLAITGILYAMVTRYFNRRMALLASMIFWTSPIIGLESSAPILDLGWAFYEFLALSAFFRWRDSQQIRELGVAGLAMGFALSNKNLAGVGVVLLGFLILFWNLIPSVKWRPMIQQLTVFGFAATLVVLPWYLKNAIWFGNPVYPFFGGAYGIMGTIRHGSGDLGGWVGMGLGNDWRALLMFPWNVYANWQVFSSPMNRGGPSYFFWLLPVYVFLPKHDRVNELWLVGGIRFFAWWFFTQNLRYLLPLFPILAFLSAYVLETLIIRWRRPSLQMGLVSCVLIFYMIALGLHWGFLLVLRENALGFIMGQVSRREYLSQNLLNYPATDFINKNLPADAKILELGDARVYYVERAILPDESHDNWVYLLSLETTLPGIAARLKSLGVTHVWVSEDDLKYVRLMWKIPGLESQDNRFNAFREQYLDQVYKDERGYTIFQMR